MAFTEQPGRLSFTWTSRFPLIQADLKLTPRRCDHRTRNRHFPVEVEWHWNYQHYSRMWEVVYTAVTPPLTEGCLYEYQVGSGLIKRKMGVFKVHTANRDSHRQPPDAYHETSLLVVSDLGVGRSAHSTIKALRKKARSLQYDALLHIGDIAYDLDAYRPYIARTFFADMEDITSKIPYMVLPGNHEYARNFEQYKSEFHMPWNKVNKGNSEFYSFNLGPGHFISLSTEQFIRGPTAELSAQLEWLQNDLAQAAVRRKSVPWLIVMAHRPFYCNADYSHQPYSKLIPAFNEYCVEHAIMMRREVEDMFYKAKVDLVLTGHVHNYQRMQPVYRNESQPSEYDGLHVHVNPTAPVYILNGGGGSELGSDPLSRTPQSWTLVQNRETSYAVLTLVNSTHLYWEQISSVCGKRLDYLWISKSD